MLRTVTVTVNEECRRKAMEDVAPQKAPIELGCCCMVFHGLRAAGIPVRNVGEEYFQLGDGDWRLPYEAVQLTMLDAAEWPYAALPVTFPVEVPEECLGEVGNG